MNHDQDAGFVLIVDDNPTNLAVLAQTLESAGLEIRVAVDGQSALETVEYELPALILLDVEMPGIDGFETCSRLKANPVTQHIPIIFMTALADTANKVKGLSLGAIDYITKPFEQEEVLARVRVHLQLHHLTQTLEEKSEVLQQQNCLLEQLTNQLEQRVEERTAALQSTQVQMVQQEKLSMLGQLVAGIAHEMNNPIGCIVSNITPAKQYIADLSEIIQLYQQHYPQPAPAIRQALDDLEIEFVLEDLPKLLDSMRLSSDRIKDISVSLRNFSRSDSTSKVAVNLHDGLDSTLVILGHRLKANSDRPAVSIVKAYGELPQVECYPGPLNQVFMNILANAIDAIEEAAPSTPQIQIQTELIKNTAIVRISDNAGGIPEAVQGRLFDPLFTTKPVGKGTGLGLSIARQIVEDQHGGTLRVATEIGRGTMFEITLPISAPSL